MDGYSYTAELDDLLKKAGEAYRIYTKTQDISYLHQSKILKHQYNELYKEWRQRERI